MRWNLMTILSLLAMAISSARSASAQDTRTVWQTDGKRYWRTEAPARPSEMPKTYMMEVPPGEEKSGDIQGFKYVGKRVEPAYFRETPIATEAHKGHECSWRMVYQNKGRTTRYNFCLENGVESACVGMTDSGECLGMKKK